MSDGVHALRKRTSWTVMRSSERGRARYCLLKQTIVSVDTDRVSSYNRTKENFMSDIVISDRNFVLTHRQLRQKIVSNETETFGVYYRPRQRILSSETEWAVLTPCVPRG
jgi:hypothetical protein